MKQGIEVHPLPSLTSPGIHQVTRSLHRYRRQLALATSIAATCIHYINQPCSSIPSSGYSYSTFESTLRKSNRSTHIGQSLLSETKRPAPPSRRSAARTFATIAQEQPSNTNQPPPSFSKDNDADKTDTADTRDLSEINDIGELMRHPALLKDIKKPRNPIVLCHGLYGFDVRGPFWGLEIHYWASVLDILREKVGAEVIVRGVPGTGAIADRAEKLHEFLASKDSGMQGKSVNFVAHSMGGLDARHIISVIKPKPEEYKPISLTTICTPHKGSPFMDWCNANVGTGNDLVEAEVSKAKKRMGKDSATTEELQEATRAAESEERKKLPFSLKTPLFVRPSKAHELKEEVKEQKKDDDTSAVDTIKATLTNVAAKATSFTPTPPLSEEGSSSAKEAAPAPSRDDTNGNKKREKEKPSILNFGSFNKAMSNIGGLFSSYMLGVLDQPAYAMLSTRYMSQVFNPSVPDSPDVAYFSIASRKRSLPIWHPLWLPKTILDAAAESRSAGGETDGSADALGGQLQGNDGLVSVESAKWGTFLGIIEGCDHWDLRGGGAPRWRGRMNPATNKPWSDDDKDAKRREEEKERNGNKSWMDINTVLGKLLNRKDAKETIASKSQANEKVEEKSAEEEKNEGMLDEVAGWISDRLPQGDEKRRAQADRVAEEHDRTVQKPKADEAEEDMRSGVEKVSTTEDQKLERRIEEKAAPSDTPTSVKLRREAAWQEQLGHVDAARELRRELDWHRANRSRDNTSSTKGEGIVTSLRNMDWGERPSKQDGKDAKKKVDDVNELERFWIALCRHLWNHGY
jgi:triacylglycerol lipase